LDHFTIAFLVLLGLKEFGSLRRWTLKRGITMTSLDLFGHWSILFHRSSFITLYLPAYFREIKTTTRYTFFVEL